MRKDILEKALRLADKSTVRPEKVIVASPRQMAKVSEPEMLTARLYTRVTPSQHNELLRHVPAWEHISELLRALVTEFLKAKTNERTRKKN